MTTAYIANLLNEKVDTFNQKGFVQDDPISIPHRFSKQEDIEIMAFWASMLAWGQRKTIINKCNELVERMDGSPHEFIMNHSSNDLKSIIGFKHRTFNEIDALHFIAFFRSHYSNHNSLENAFMTENLASETTTEASINHFYDYFFGLEHSPNRTRKHIACPAKKSACKRINMFLRWMVRKDNRGVDFGIWNHIKPSQLICPLDVHVDRVARKLGLLKRTQSDWKAATELTEALRRLDPNDPVKYDFALFGLGLDGFA